MASAVGTLWLVRADRLAENTARRRALHQI
jgi:hypothetical protein